MLYSIEKLKEEGRCIMRCDVCDKPVPYYKGKKGEGVKPLYEWQGNGFCVECFEEIVKVNPNVIYPAVGVD